jgi:hypothetical protein
MSGTNLSEDQTKQAMQVWLVKPTGILQCSPAGLVSWTGIWRLSQAHLNAWRLSYNSTL